MRKIVIGLGVAVILLFGLTLIGCNNSSSALEDHFLIIGASEVLPDIYDNGQDTVYIKRKRLRLSHTIEPATEDFAITNIMAKKQQWQNHFPQNKVITMSIVTGDRGGHGLPTPIGLLIHYEKQFVGVAD